MVHLDICGPTEIALLARIVHVLNAVVVVVLIASIAALVTVKIEL